MGLDEWADNFRYMNGTTGEKWFTERVGIAQAPMKAVTEPGVRTISIMCCTQLMKTELILNTIGYFSHLDPCPMLIVHPKDESARKFSHTRLKEMIRATPVLKEAYHQAEFKDSTDTALYKEFRGGYVSIVSAKVPANLAMLPIRIVLLDEIDKFDESSGKEGDPVQLAEERMAKFSSNSLSIRACSPTIKGASRIEASYESSDKRKPFVECPHCNHWQILKWPNVKWNKDEEGNGIADSAEYFCEGCGVAWTESQRLTAIKMENIRWLQTAQFTCRTCHEVNKPELWSQSDKGRWNKEGRAICQHCEKGLAPNKHAGFWANKLYSPFRPISEMVELWLDIKGNVEKLKMFINTQLAETFEEAGEQIKNIDWLVARRELYDGTLPSKVGIITAGIDTQNNRLEIETVGWGEDEESWSLDYKVIAGDPSDPETWRRLDEYIKKPWIRHDGRMSYIAAACIDMQGGHTQHVTNYCRTRIVRRIWPIRGVGGDGNVRPVWPRNPGRGGKQTVPFYNIGVDAGKNVVFTRLFIEQEGAGYCHFPLDREEDWFKQLTAEKRITKVKGTRKILVWENPSGARNEAFDCRVYAYAALQGMVQMGYSVNKITETQSLIMRADFEEQRKSGNIKQGATSPSSKKGNNHKATRRIAKSSFMDK